jgi:hypothetical protein
MQRPTRPATRPAALHIEVGIAQTGFASAFFACAADSSIAYPVIPEQKIAQTYFVTYEKLSNV